jgi:alkylhydroperoxidase family enzyme
MKPRMNFYQAAPDTIKALSALEAQVQASGLEQSLIELVKTRASQINGCAFASTCTPRTPASTARPNSACIC